MEIGTYGWKRDIDFIHHGLSLGGPQFIQITAPATFNYGVLNVGDAPFDGASSGHFTGNAIRTYLAINAQASFIGNVINYQLSGSNKYILGYIGDTYILSDPFSVTSSGLLTLGSQISTGAGQFAGSANGTYLAINAPSGFSGNLADWQINGVVKFSLNGNGANIPIVVSSDGTYGLLNLGSGGFGGAAGNFAGSANGTVLAINEPSSFTGNLADWQVNGVNKFKVDNAGAVTAASTVTAGTKAAPFPLTNSITLKSSDSTMNSNTAFVDGPTVSCVAGTWLLVACCTVVCGSTAGTLTGKLWDGTTVISSSETRQTASQASSITLAGVVVPGSTTSYKMSVATTTGATNASTLKAAAVNNGAGNNATWITAVRIG